MAFEESKYRELKTENVGQVNGWKGEMKLVRYQYGDGPVSVKVVVVGETKKGEKYESKIMSGLPETVLKKIVLPRLLGFTK